MPKFTINVPFETDDAVVEVTHDPAASLQRGRHRFRLEVVDDSGNVSEPDEVVVIVADRDRPTAVLDAPDIVSSGTSFLLSGKRSFDVGGGQIKNYRFTYLGPQV